MAIAQPIRFAGQIPAPAMPAGTGAGNGPEADPRLNRDQEADLGTSLNPCLDSSLGSGLDPNLDPDMLSILRTLQSGERFLVCSHSRPDGDAIGSMLAMGMLLRQMGKRVDLVAADRIPAVYRGLPGADEIRHVMRVHEGYDGPYDAVVILECDGLERTRLRGLDRMRHINIDHHASGKRFGEWNWIDRHACSVGELVHRMVKATSGTVTAEMATCLYVTLLTDTGGFCYGGIQANTFRLAGELVEAGADPVAIARDVYFANPFAKLQILGKALSNLHRTGVAEGKEEDRGGEIAWLWITNEDMVSVHGSEEDCEGVVNYALSAAGVEAAAFLRELPEGRIRLSLRSKGRINVAAIATGLGGGGHENASGCTLDGPLERAAEEILAALRSEMKTSEMYTSEIDASGLGESGLGESGLGESRM